MPKEKVFEYRFKVSDYANIDKERICRENMNAEMIIVIPESREIATIILRRDLELANMEHDQWSEYSSIQPARFKYVQVYKDSIPCFINAYKEMKAKKPKPKQEVIVKCFGEVEAQSEDKCEIDICKHCKQEIYKEAIGGKDGAKWLHISNSQAECNINHIKRPVAEPDLPF